MCGYGWHHAVLKDNMSSEVWRMHKSMQEEYRQLQQLLAEVSWYNFEVSAREMTSPWNVSNPQSQLRLQGMRFGRRWSAACGAYVEYGDFPDYFNGTVEAAPPLPVAIVLNETKDVLRQLRLLRAAAEAPYTFAPGGKEYRKLLRTTTIPTKYSLRRFSGTDTEPL